MFFGFILQMLPMYNWLRLAFFVFMMAPQTNGAHTMYIKIFKPILVEHKDEIEAFISKVKSGASEAAKEGINQAKKKASEAASAENIMKAAAVAQKVREEAVEEK